MVYFIGDRVVCARPNHKGDLLLQDATVYWTKAIGADQLLYAVEFPDGYRRCANEKDLAEARQFIKLGAKMGEVVLAGPFIG